jgi:xylulokinase
MAGLTRGKLSRLLPPGAIAGKLRADVAASAGLPAGLPVVVGAGDGQSAGLGCNVTRAGRAYLNLGTGTVSGVHADRYSHATAYRTMGGPVPGSYILETFIGGGTQNVVWFIEQLGVPKGAGDGGTPEQVLEEAAAVPPGAGGLLCLPYWTGAMTPYWDGHARGAFVGLSGLHGKAHMYRAVLEGIALEQRLLTTGVEHATGQPIEEILMLGGGSRSPLWCQIIADVLGRPVKLVREQESTALGAGIHAAAALGLHSGLSAAAEAMTGIDRSHEPDRDNHTRYAAIFEAYRSIYPGLKSTFHLMAEAAS